MAFYLVTPCGRHGKQHREPFLRRRSTLEPMEAPRKYYKSDAHYREGQGASAAAWQTWKEGIFGDADVGRATWFELVEELTHITDLVQSPNGGEFQNGVRRLEERNEAVKEADEKLVAAKGEKRLGVDEREELRKTVRRGPPLLASILRDLQSGGKRKQEAKEKLARLGDDVAASQTMRPVTSQPPLASQTPIISLPSVQPSVRSQALRTTRAITTQLRHHNQIHIPSHRQGSQFGLAHDPGESSGATARPGNMFAQSTAPAHQSSRTSRTASRATSRTPSRVGNSTSRNPAHSHASRPSHTARTGAHRGHNLSSIPESSQIGRTAVQACHSTLRAPPPTIVSPHSPSRTPSGPVPSRPPPTYVTLAPGGPTRRSAQKNAYAARSRRPGAPALPSAQTMAYMQSGGTKSPTYIPSPQFFEEHGAEHGMCS